MNREIKFRAWDKYRLKMFEDVQYGLDLGIEISFGSLLSMEDIVLMQYTGLKDKNGKEVYEGDVLSNSQGKKGIVIFEDGCFKLQLHKSETSSHYVPLNISYLENKEVIGNIYQNPELLTGNELVKQ
jgi:uncharacterized phage protein (TIGR01671 family)